MPLRDHFNPPLSDQAQWRAFHGQWPAMIVIELNKRLPAQYVARPQVQMGSNFEIDLAAHTTQSSSSWMQSQGTPDEDDGGGVATAVWAPPRPTLAIATGLPEQDEYEVEIFESDMMRLVAAIEIVSPGNKDRPENRRAFAGKCASLLRQGVSVSIVDLVTVRNANLYGDLLDLIGQSDPSLAPAPPALYTAACRWHQIKRSWRLETWVQVMEVGKPLPTLPLWLSPDLAVPLNLELSYLETFGALRIR